MKSPSTRTLDDLPSIDDLIRLSKGLAMLDAILGLILGVSLVRKFAQDSTSTGDPAGVIQHILQREVLHVKRNMP